MHRKTFLKTLAAGAVISVLDKQLLLAGTGRKHYMKVSTLPLLETDVLVVGAGPSGIPAAIAAARQGVKVILIEQDNLPGGAPVNMFVSMLCGSPRVGIYREMIQKLNASYTTTGSPRPDFGYAGINKKDHWYQPSSFVMVLSEMIANERNITFIKGIKVRDVILKEGNRNEIKGVIIERFGQRQEIRAKITIDATGNGLIAALSGAPVMYGRDGRSTFNETIGAELPDNKVQRCTWMYISQRLHQDAILPWSALKSKGMVEDDYGWLKSGDENRKAGLYLHWGATVDVSDTRDDVAIAEAQLSCLKKFILQDELTLREAGFRVHLAPKMGIRESRRIKGDYVITVNHLKSGSYPEDTIAHANYGLDAWGESFSEEDKKTKPYGIPYRSLIPLDCEGLLVAGKAISGTHLAASSYRVQPIVSSIGQAAGTAAALTVNSNTSLRNIDVKTLIAKLTSQGLFIGNNP